MPAFKPNYFPAPYEWIPGVWCIRCYVYEETTVALMMVLDQYNRPKIFHHQHEAKAYAATL